MYVSIAFVYVRTHAFAYEINKYVHIYIYVIPKRTYVCMHVGMYV